MPRPKRHLGQEADGGVPPASQARGEPALLGLDLFELRASEARGMQGVGAWLQDSPPLTARR